MSKKALRDIVNPKDLNMVFLVGEIVDFGVTPHKHGITSRVRLKIRKSKRYDTFVYLDVYGKRSIAETMNLVCQVGNIVYLEGEFRNATMDRVMLKPYVLVKHITCLRRRRDVAPPKSEDVVTILDSLDPTGYFDKEDEDNG